MNHEVIEKNMGLMLLLVVAVISLGGLAEIVPRAIIVRNAVAACLNRAAYHAEGTL